jgi:hypothetical protein
MSDCDEECRRRNCVAPVSRGVFREVVGASPGVASFDEVVVRRWLDEHPNPLVVVPGRGAYEPRDGATVSDVVRAAIR